MTLFQLLPPAPDFPSVLPALLLLLRGTARGPGLPRADHLQQRHQRHLQPQRRGRRARPAAPRRGSAGPRGGSKHEPIPSKETTRMFGLGGVRGVALTPLRPGGFPMAWQKCT